MAPASPHPQPRYFVFSRSGPRMALLPGQVIHRVEVVHDATSPRPSDGSRRYDGFALYDPDRRQLVALFVYHEPGHVLAKWPLPPPESIDDIPVRHTRDTRRVGQ